jgi:hypothetical protein
MDNAVALASWSSIRDADVTESMNIVNVDVAQLDLHNHLPWGRLGDGAGHQFQSAQRILAVESILHNPNIGHGSNRCRTKQGNLRSTGGARSEVGESWRSEDVGIDTENAVQGSEPNSEICSTSLHVLFQRRPEYN